jgi:hypothetical protein
MAIEFGVLRKERAEQSETFRQVADIAGELRHYLDEAAMQKLIVERHVLNAPSTGIQQLMLESVTKLGFRNEEKGLFSGYEVSALRPDYFCKVGDTGILLEVERGKTTTNNMDLLDLWKCHICRHASYLFLVVPQVRLSKSGKRLRHFSHVRKRLAPFFEERNYVNVDAVFLFGY